MPVPRAVKVRGSAGAVPRGSGGEALLEQVRVAAHRHQGDPLLLRPVRQLRRLHNLPQERITAQLAVKKVKIKSSKNVFHAITYNFDKVLSQ